MFLWLMAKTVSGAFDREKKNTRHSGKLRNPEAVSQTLKS
jgi:hypothetical protein